MKTNQQKVLLRFYSRFIVTIVSIPIRLETKTLRRAIYINLLEKLVVFKCLLTVMNEQDVLGENHLRIAINFFPETPILIQKKY